MFTDTHAHLYAEEFDADRSEMMERAMKAGVSRFFLPNIDSSSIDVMMKMAADFPGRCFPMMGLHPCSVKENFRQELEVVKQWLDKEKFCAVGEIGIDLYWDKTFFEEQKEAFRLQIQWAKEKKLPIVIHARQSMNEIFELVDGLNDENLKGIFHCFSGDYVQAQKVISYGGFKLGIGGVVTFKNGGIDQYLSKIPVEYIVLETDSPYLAPVPHRGKRNESAYIPLVADKVASLYQLNISELAKITTQNAKEIFGF
ncbi:MAG: TatD family hydrolase [Bacteroidota bacterium]